MRSVNIANIKIRENCNDTPPYIINLMDRDNIETDTVDILSYLTVEGFNYYLDRISGRFFSLNIPTRHETPQLYFVMQDDMKYMKIGISKTPLERLRGLQTGNPIKLKLLFYYDPVEYYKDSVFIDDFGLDAFGHEKNKLRWYRGNIPIENEASGEWIVPDNRCFRILIREGLFLLEWYHARQNNL